MAKFNGEHEAETAAKKQASTMREFIMKIVINFQIKNFPQGCGVALLIGWVRFSMPYPQPQTRNKLHRKAND